MYLLIISSKLEMDFNTEIANCKVDNLDNLFKEIYKRLIIPFYVPLLMLIPLLLITSSKENNNYQKLKSITFIIGLFFIIFSETTIRLISENLSTNYVLIIMPVIFLLILYFLFYKKLNFKIK